MSIGRNSIDAPSASPTAPASTQPSTRSAQVGGCDGTGNLRPFSSNPIGKSCRPGSDGRIRCSTGTARLSMWNRVIRSTCSWLVPGAHSHSLIAMSAQLLQRDVPALDTRVVPLASDPERGSRPEHDFAELLAVLGDRPDELAGVAGIDGVPDQAVAGVGRIG